MFWTLFLSFLGVICGRQERQYLELGSIIFKTNAIVSLELTLTLIVLDFLEKSSYWINYIAFHRRYAFSVRPKKSIPLPPLLPRMNYVYRASIELIKFDKYGYEQKAHGRFQGNINIPELFLILSFRQ